MNYPSEIEKTVLALAECNRQSAELRERLAAMEAIIIQDIAAAKTLEGKPQFSNESVRAAELTLRMRDDAEATNQKEQIERGEMQKQQHLRTTRTLARRVQTLLGRTPSRNRRRNEHVSRHIKPNSTSDSFERDVLYSFKALPTLKAR
ncbi:MAG: hypothetical protein LC778_20190 [Acidobacteria bacterium]|nr:hypothetical protein [Acidobacteriota bacterium]